MDIVKYAECYHLYILEKLQEDCGIHKRLIVIYRKYYYFNVSQKKRHNTNVLLNHQYLQ